MQFACIAKRNKINDFEIHALDFTLMGHLQKPRYIYSRKRDKTGAQNFRLSRMKKSRKVQHQKEQQAI